MPIQKIRTESVEDSLNYFAIAPIIIPPTTTTYTIANLQFDFDVDAIDIKTDTGTLDLKVQIDGTDVVWDSEGSTVNVTSSALDDTAASAFSFSAGDNLVLDISNIASSPNKVELTLHCTRT
jgi:hypothetical protein